MLNSEARERVLEAAERLFAEKGYKAVTLKAIAAEVGIRHATLYHHVQSKEQLFIEVTERSLHRHRAAIEQALAGSAGSVRQQLHAVASWLLSQPPMDLVRMSHVDMPALAPEEAWRLSQLAMESLFHPVTLALYQAESRGEIEHSNLGLVAGGLVGMISSLHALPPGVSPQSPTEMAHELIDVVLNGLLKN